jgi:hypothetical protein
MKWFWNPKQAQEGEERLSGSKGIPGPVGSYMVVQMKMDPNRVWQLKGVVRPAGKKGTFYCRVFDNAQVAQAGLKVKDWTSLDGHPELILWKATLTKEQTRCAMRSLLNAPISLIEAYWRSERWAIR